MRLALLLALVPAPLLAHPHVFVEATVEVLAKAGEVTGVRLVWTYDDLFSLLLTEDLGLDGDGDLALTDAERATLEASVADWPADFTGDMVVTGGVVTGGMATGGMATGGNGARPLGPRENHVVAFDAGRVVESHRRPLAALAATPGAPVVIEVFDPYHYVAYTITGATVTGDPSCKALIVPVDLEAAQAQVDATWAGLDWAGASPDTQLPAIGAAFADRVEVRCGG